MFGAVAVFSVDQLSKWLVREHIAVGTGRVELLPFLELRHVHNTGIAFGLLQGQARLVLIGTVVVAALLLLTLTTVPATDWRSSAGIALIAGGALGNLADRIRHGYVTDFIHLPNWPTFNVADSAIVLGVTTVLLMQLVLAREQPAESAAGEDHADRG